MDLQPVRQQIEKHDVSLTTDSAGDVTAYTSGQVTGRILAVIYTKTDFADTVDITVTMEDTGEAILTLTNRTTSGVFYPRPQVHDNTGTGATLDGTRAMRDYVWASKDRVKVVVAQGGDAKTGTVTIVVG